MNQPPFLKTGFKISYFLVDRKKSFNSSTFPKTDDTVTRVYRIIRVIRAPVSIKVTK